MEKPKDSDTLGSLKLTEILLPSEVALKKLTARTHAAIKNNLDNLAKHFLDPELKAGFIKFKS